MNKIKKEDFKDWYINTSGQQYMPFNQLWTWIEENIIGDLERIKAAAKNILSETAYFEVGDEGEHFEDTNTYKDLESLLYHEVSKVKCDLCGYKWFAVRPLGTEKLECPNCENIGDFENI